MEGKETVVVDASIAVKWFNPEEYSDKADELKELHVKGIIRLTSPVLLLFEVTNALRYNPEFGIEDVRRAVLDLVDLQISLVDPYPELMDEALRLAFNYGITIYDSCYVALAKEIGCLAYTADEKLLEKLEGKEPLRHISSFG